MIKDEALTLALEALENYPAIGLAISGADAWNQCQKAITAIKEALAQPEQPEGDIDFWIRSATEARQAEMKMRREIAKLQPKPQPEQEPVAQEKPYAQVLVDWFDEANGFSHGTKAPHKWVLQAEAELRRFLHPTPPQPKPLTERPWVGLTDAERDECDWGQGERDFARIIEAKLKEKNT